MSYERPSPTEINLSQLVDKIGWEELSALLLKLNEQKI